MLPSYRVVALASAAATGDVECGERHVYVAWGGTRASNALYDRMVSLGLRWWQTVTISLADGRRADMGLRWWLHVFRLP